MGLLTAAIITPSVCGNTAGVIDIVSILLHTRARAWFLQTRVKAKQPRAAVFVEFEEFQAFSWLRGNHSSQAASTF